MFDKESRKILYDSVEFWNQTERIVKKAEQLRGELVIPAVTELRYAGRKLVDFNLSRLEREPIEESRKHIIDYEQCCVRARHDAVDAMVMYMKTYYNHMMETFGADVIHQNFPHHYELRRAIEIVDERVLISREERHQRVDLYSQINGDSVDELVEKFKELVASEDIMKGIRTARDNEHRLAVKGYVVGVIGTILGVVGLILTALTFL